ncbi:MAG: DUF2283 domain-containing protein, partial [Candidatus Hadarchaeum sp.]
MRGGVRLQSQIGNPKSIILVTGCAGFIGWHAGMEAKAMAMRVIYDPTVDALSIRLVEERVECETIRLNDQVAVDIGPGERIVAIEVLDASELIPA